MERSPPLQNAPRLHGFVPVLLPVALALPAPSMTTIAATAYVPLSSDGQTRGLFRPPRA